jgi:hypothetical protein
MALHSAHILTAVVATATPITLSVISGTITLDDSWTPYAQAELTVYTPNQAFIDSIDPRQNIRVNLTVTQTFLEDSRDRAAVTRPFDLMLRERRIDAETGTMTLYLESDEAQLRDLALVSLTSERSYGVSVKGAVTYALGKIGATLQAGAADATIPTRELEPVLTNLAINPSGEANPSGWSGTSNSTLSRVATESFTGVGSLQAVSGSGSELVMVGTSSPITSGLAYTVSLYVKTQFVRSVRIESRFRNAAGVGLGSDILGTAKNTSTTAWTRYELTTTAPAGAATIQIIYRTVTAMTSGEKHFIDAAMITQSASALPYFDGYTVGTRDAGLYSVAWTSGVDSASTLTNLPNSDAMIWKPGVTAAQYIQPLVDAGGLRLICDERRRWYLVTALSVDGQINVSSETGVISGEDNISRNDDSPWYDSVVIRYEWNDDQNNQQTAYDIAGTGGGLTLLQVVERVFLGAGAAAAILGRAQGKGRTFQVSSQSNYFATPGISVSIALPDTVLQTGTLSKVSWSFPEAVMSIGSRGLTDTPARAWVLAPTGRTWSNQPATTWNTYNS